ncbi:MAG: hypothetical protein AAGA66_12870 [Bacteroidota bacterium]
MMKTSTQKQPKRSLRSGRVETGHGGTATIVDNRPSAIYQRQLRATMDAHVASRSVPLQRKAPRGSARFQQIAMKMGEKYGVDTSGLNATHQSSFPSKLNAEATIQGNNIHFAPGKDTNYNMHHEVLHAVDNALHGTPRGDRMVNGQKVDTTREKVVDQMVRSNI